MIAFYAHTITPRLQYVIHFLSEYYGQSIILRTLNVDAAYPERESVVHIGYTETSLPGSIHIKPYGLLDEDGIRSVPVTCFQHNAGYKAFFKTENDDLGFDIFSAIFYLLTRYEEYLPHGKDMYGRYAHENCLAYKNDFLQLPLVNNWLEDFGKYLGAAKLAPRRFSFLPTYDIDMAWSYREKGFLRNAGGFLKSLIKGNLSAVRSRLKVLTGNSPDPFDCFDRLQNLHSFYELQAHYFFHVGKNRNRYDKGIPTANEAFRKLVRTTSNNNSIGVHPSWNSGDNPSLIATEREALEEIVKSPVSSSRQHYIRFTLPQTYRQLMAAGITDDYSMGYGSINGFRASVATPFYWYDLKKETATTLRLHPFCFMDANAYYEQKLSATKAYEELLHYYTEVKRVNGNLIIIWHNNILGSDKEFAGWKEMYQRFLEQVTIGLS